MKRRFLSLAVGCWCIQLACAVSLGAARQLVLAPAVGEMAARAVGTIALCAAIYGLARRFVRRHPASAPARLGLGVLWCALTLAFEEQKKYEQVAETIRLAQRKEAARRETAALDELGLRRAAGGFR